MYAYDFELKAIPGIEPEPRGGSAPPVQPKAGTRSR